MPKASHRDSNSGDASKQTKEGFWTNPSVIALSANQDPITAVTQKTRDLVFKAIEDGWQGPPFDPFWLASYCSIAVTARDDIPDARLISEAAQTTRIEFNPNQPRARVRFSVAHEIGHTLFPDHAQVIRNRSKSTRRGDEWQLELLCNIAASEILMPPAPTLNVGSDRVTIQNLVKLWATYDVSPEALLLRIVKLTSQPFSIFSAAPISDSTESDFRLDYCIPSGSSDIRLPSGLRIPSGTALSECTAIGFSAKGTESWMQGIEMDIECIGIPPYPGRVFPRVVGILRRKNLVHSDSASIQFIYGDVTKPRGEGRKIIAHIVNDKTPNWGAGAARAIATAWPAVKEDFRNWVDLDGGHLRLGHVRETPLGPELSVVSMVSQHGYGPSSKPRIRYSALEQCLQELCKLAKKSAAMVHMPRIGTGYAGGNWAVIEELIRENLISQGIKVIVYQLPDVTRARGQTFLESFTQEIVSR